MAQSGHSFLRRVYPLLRVRRTWSVAAQMSANDQERTSAENLIDSGHLKAH